MPERKTLNAPRATNAKASRRPRKPANSYARKSSMCAPASTACARPSRQWPSACRAPRRRQAARAQACQRGSQAQGRKGPEGSWRRPSEIAQPGARAAGALKKESARPASPQALSRQASAAASQRSAADRSAAARKAARTKGAAGRSRCQEGRAHPRRQPPGAPRGRLKPDAWECAVRRASSLTRAVRRTALSPPRTRRSDPAGRRAGA